MADRNSSVLESLMSSLGWLAALTLGFICFVQYGEIRIAKARVQYLEVRLQVLGTQFPPLGTELKFDEASRPVVETIERLDVAAGALSPGMGSGMATPGGGGSASGMFEDFKFKFQVCPRDWTHVATQDVEVFAYVPETDTTPSSVLKTGSRIMIHPRREPRGDYIRAVIPDGTEGYVRLSFFRELEPGDYPLRDMLVDGSHPFPSDIEEMLRKLDTIRPSLLTEFSDSEFDDWQQGKHLDAGRARLQELLNQNRSTRTQ